MNNKLIYRTIGSLSSAMIIVSVFIPFFKFSGYTQSIWEGYSGNFIFLPILIIIFGLIGVLVFSLNKKIELAYATSGAMIFYSVMRTVEIANQGIFESLSAGYYFLVIGSVLTGIITFLCNIKPKENVDNVDMVQTKMSMDNMMQPMQQIENNNMDLNSNLTPLMDNSNINNMQVENSNLFSTFQNQPEIDLMNQTVIDNTLNPVQEPIIEEIPNQLNVQQQFNQPIIEPINTIPQINPLSEQQYNQQNLNNIEIPQPINQMQTNNQILNNIPNIEPINVPIEPIFENQSIEQQPFINNNISNVQNYSMPINQQNSNVISNETDIFGQPINRN